MLLRFTGGGEGENSSCILSTLFINEFRPCFFLSSQGPPPPPPPPTATPTATPTVPPSPSTTSRICSRRRGSLSRKQATVRRTGPETPRGKRRGRTGTTFPINNLVNTVFKIYFFFSNRSSSTASSWAYAGQSFSEDDKTNVSENSEVVCRVLKGGIEPQTVDKKK